jgi:hypothetical protein
VKELFFPGEQYNKSRIFCVDIFNDFDILFNKREQEEEKTWKNKS